MNILVDKEYNSKYVFHIGDLLGNMLFTLRLNDINPNEISLDLLEKYICILAEKYTKDKIKAEFVITKEEIEKFLKNNSDFYKKSEDNKKIVLLKELTAVDLAQRHHNAMPFKVLEATVSGEVQSKLIDVYNGNNPKVLEKTK